MKKSDLQIKKADSPLLMEDYFSPGMKTKPAVHVGSQTVSFFNNNKQEQAWEGYYLVGATDKDIGVVRNFDNSYIDYWKNLTGNPHIINIRDENAGVYLSERLINDPTILQEIRTKMHPASKLHVFFPTELEKKLADQIGIPLHGSPSIGLKFGTKSGIRTLAKKAGVPMAPGFVCRNVDEVKKAVKELFLSFPSVILKHDTSVSGYFSKKLNRDDVYNINQITVEISGGSFGKDSGQIVVEAWVENSISVCAHIEILHNKYPEICAAWQQIIDTDGISYIGAGPLNLSDRALGSFLINARKLADELKKEGAIGSFGPDFIITPNDSKSFSPNTALLIELNARIPMSAMPMEMVKKIKGHVGNGFLFQHVKLKKPSKFSKIAQVLRDADLLITAPGSNITGVVPYNVGLLPWKIFDIAVIADSWNQAQQISRQTKTLLNSL